MCSICYPLNPHRPRLREKRDNLVRLLERSLVREREPRQLELVERQACQAQPGLVESREICQAGEVEGLLVASPSSQTCPGSGAWFGSLRCRVLVAGSGVPPQSRSVPPHSPAVPPTREPRLAAQCPRELTLLSPLQIILVMEHLSI